MPSIALPDIVRRSPPFAPDADARTRWTPLHRDVLLPLLLLAIATIVLQPLGGDRWLADRLFVAEGGRWALRNAFWTTHVLHAGGKALSTLAWCATAAIAVLSSWRNGWGYLRRPAWLLLLSVSLSTLAVAETRDHARLEAA